MPHTIHKFELPHHGTSSAYATFKRGSQILCVANQRGIIQMWMQVPLDRHVPSATVTAADAGFYETRRFLCVYTGEEVPDGAKYVGTTMSADGAHVTHVYEVA